MLAVWGKRLPHSAQCCVASHWVLCAVLGIKIEEGHKTIKENTKEGYKGGECCKGQKCEKQMKSLALFSLEKRLKRCSWQHMSYSQEEKGRCWSLLSGDINQNWGNRKRGSDRMLGKKFFTKLWSGAGTRSPGKSWNHRIIEVMASRLEFKKNLDTAFRWMVSVALC